MSEEFDFDNREMVAKRLQELKDANIPKMTLDKLVALDEFKYLQKAIDNATQEEIDKANEYFSMFCEYGYNDGRDIFTDKSVSLGWGLKHGVLCCIDGNGLDRVGMHYITLAGKKYNIGGNTSIYELPFPLQYHPDGYEVCDEDED